METNIFIFQSMEGLTILKGGWGGDGGWGNDDSIPIRMINAKGEGEKIIQNGN